MGKGRSTVRAARAEIARETKDRKKTSQTTQDALMDRYLRAHTPDEDLSAQPVDDTPADE
ncbi:hypothetical protein [Streptomyces sp. NPDC056672]|uniref:hypothetical protein n=1 Tax=Streptomyces sp. NPDC056672 TaxID=3345906 RepID=UPI0036C1A64E